MIKKISIILFLLLNLIYAQKKVPNWFINLPESNNHSMYAVGYTGAFYDSIQAKSVAEYRAIKNMTRQKQIQLIFEVTQLSDGRYRLFKPSFEQIYEEYILHEIIDNYSVVDSVFTKNGCYVLIQYPASVKKTKDFVSEIQHWSNKPGWVDKLPINNKYIYGIGITANYSRNYRAWQDTDNYSRFDLGKNISVNSQSVSQEKRTGQYSISASYLTQSTNILLNNCIIISRWYDVEHDIYYSLSRLPKNSYSFQNKITY